MKTKNLIIYIIICLIVIAGVAVWESKGFRTELQYAPRKQILLYNYKGIDISDIENIAKEVLGDTRFLVQPVETFGNEVSIVAKDITEEQKNQIVDKFKEKYTDSDIEKNNVEIVVIPFTRIKDVIKKYIAPGIASLAVITLYFLIRYNKLGLKNVLITTLLLPSVAELVMFSIISIARVPFSRYAVAVGLVVYVVSIFILTVMFENDRNKYLESLSERN